MMMTTMDRDPPHRGVLHATDTEDCEHMLKPPWALKAAMSEKAVKAQIYA